MTDSESSEILLEGTFGIIPINNERLYHVALSKKGISYTECDSNGKSAGKSLLIAFKDVTGAKIQNHEDLINSGCAKCRTARVSSLSECYLTIYCYPRVPKTSGDSTRKAKKMTLVMGPCKEYDRNYKICQTWRNTILNLLRNVDLGKGDVETCSPPPQRKILVLINPHSGPGKAKQIFEKGVMKMLEEADISYKVVVTERAGHATELMKTINISEWYGVVIVSGDGLIYEAINGLMSRPDWDKAITLPVGAIPGGSGNAMSLNINYTAGEPLDVNQVLHSTFVLIKHRVIPMDLVLIQTPAQQLYSFLSVSFGIIADIDYESEKMRALGATRFTVYFLKRLVSLRKYKARVSFLPLTEYDPDARQQKRREQTFAKSRRFTILSHSSTSTNIGNGSVYENGTNGIYRSMSLPNNGRKERSLSMPTMKNVSESLQNEFRHRQEENDLAEVDEDAENVTFELEKAESYEKSKRLSSDQDGVMMMNGNHNHNEDAESDTSDSPFEETVSMVKNSGDPVPSPLLTPLDSPVPSDWITIEDEFVTACALYQPYLGPDNLTAPDSRLNDGLIHMFLIRGEVTKVALLNLFLSIDKGEHVKSPICEMVKVLAFRIEPLTETGNIMVDGEKVPFGPIQGQVLPGMAKVMGVQ